MSWFLAFIFIFCMVLIHEFGHFFVARFFGVYIEVFSIGFGKKLFSFKKFNTTWQVSAIPLGGYVQMKGQDDSNPSVINSDSDSYSAKKPWQRILILLAGPLANILLAFVLFFSVVYFGKAKAPIIGGFLEKSSAEKAGLMINDNIISINGIKTYEWRDVPKTIKESHGNLTFLINRNGQIKEIKVEPKIMENINVFNEKVFVPMVGILPSEKRIPLNFSLLKSLEHSGQITYESSFLIAQYIEKLIVGELETKEVGGVIKITKVAADAASVNWEKLFVLSALISLNLAIFNLLPIPALDGGHIMFNAYEIVFKRPPNQKLFYYLTVTGWGILLAIFFLGFYNDLSGL